MGTPRSSNQTTDRRPLRVAQWATGNIGTRSLRHIVDHPHLELVGLLVYGADKVGRDAGELCSRGATGVIATSDPEAVYALDADCVLYMPRQPDVDELCRLLEGGANVVTTAGMVHHPPSIDPDVRSRLEDACATGGTSIHATGSSPGFISEAVPMVLASIQRRLDLVHIEEFADMSKRNSPEMIFDLMGYGRPPGDSGASRAHHLKESFGPSMRVLADALSAPLDDITAVAETAVATETVEIAAGTVAAGTVAAQRTTISGMRGGRELIRFEPTWYVTERIDPAWSLGTTGWRITVEGDAPLVADMPFSVTLDEMADVSPGYTANRAINVVHAVCAAEPGIRTTFELPPVLPVLG